MLEDYLGSLIIEIPLLLESKEIGLPEASLMESKFPEEQVTIRAFLS